MALRICQLKGNAIVDIGGNYDRCYRLSGIVCDKSVKIAGDVFTNDIGYVASTIFMLENVAIEKIKINIGAALEDLENPPEEMSTYGRDLLTGKPKQAMVSHREVARALDKSILRIEDAIMEALSQTPPEPCRHCQHWIYLAGGGSMLRGLDKRISLKTDLPVYIAEDPFFVVVFGTGNSF